MGCSCLSRCLERFYSFFDTSDIDEYFNKDIDELRKKQELIIQMRPFNLGIFAIQILSNGSSKECFRIKTKTHKDDENIIEYKLHICSSTAKAIKIDEKIKLIQNSKKLKIMPYYYGRDNNFLLFKYLNDPSIYYQITKSWNQTQILNKNVTISVESLCTKLGYVLAFANWKIKFQQNDQQLDAVKNHYHPNTFKNRLENIKLLNMNHIIQNKDDLLDIYTNLYDKYKNKLRICIDIRDVFVPKNFLIKLDDAKNDKFNLIYVDEGGIGNVYGLGLSRLYRNDSFYNNNNCKVLEYVEKGYKIVKQNKYPPLGYLKMLSLFELVSHLNNQAINDTERHFELCQMLKCVLINIDA